MNTVEFEYRIEYDTCPPDPRKDFDHIGHMVCWHPRYNLGDDHSFSSPEDFRTTLAQRADPTVEDRIEWWNNAGYERLRKTYDHWGAATEVDKAVTALVSKVLEKHYLFLPLNLYDHGGITMSTGRFSCPWDSGQVGWIYMSREEAVQNWGKPGAKLLTKRIRDKAFACLEAEVEEYDQYLTGDIHGFVIDRVEYDEDGLEVGRDEDVDSCWGFYGYDYCEQEAKATCESLKKHEAINLERQAFPVAVMGI